MTRDELIAWASERKPFENQVWVGDHISIRDVKLAVFQTLGSGDYPARCPECGQPTTEPHRFVCSRRP